ncbi:hypothetical protein [Amycolatopsis sp. NPDC021455]|uniref:hypothetical protein n=1 Tax=Amycolatopsis sp. NPDC021455 TaxID=3154901 RepID=UPI0033C43A0B
MDPEETRKPVLDALNRFYAPMPADDLVMVLALATGVEHDEEALTALAAADRAEFSAGAERPVWICPALEYSGGEASDEFLTRSDWPMRARVVRGVLSESQELWLLKQFVSLKWSGEYPPSRHLDRLHERIVDLSIHVPRERLAEKKADRGGRYDLLELWWEIAEDRHGELVRQERIAQAGVIGELERLPLPERFFGAGRYCRRDP